MLVRIKGLIDEDFVNYKKASMFIAFPSCTFKCERENPECHCQNGTLAASPDIEVDTKYIVDRYMKNSITSAIVCGGLEPIDSIEELYNLIMAFRLKTDDDVVIYTGYMKDEIEDKVSLLSSFKNIIIKFGRYVPNQEHVFDPILGVELSNIGQYGEIISKNKGGVC